MTAAGEQPDHRSIGEVLNLVKVDFDDITISKIRFLEGQGLLDPERTPSGYRKFYDDDIDRLRWILRQQREHFLPLKVIKERLDAAPAGTLPDETLSSRPEQQTLVPEPEPPVTAPEPVADESSPPAEAPRPRLFADRVEAGEPSTSESPTPSIIDPPEVGSVSLTREELAAAAGVTVEVVAELQKYGLIDGAALGSSTVYDDQALLVAKVAAGFAGHGVDARHLRMYKVAAEREAGVFEQLVLPVARSAGRDGSVEKLDELSALGSRMRAAMLRRSLRGLVR